MSDLELLDPTHADDPAFDPDGPQAARVRAGALRARGPARAASRRRPLALAGAAVAAAAAAIAVTVGTSTVPPDAVAALRDAARQTAAVDSGRVVVTVEGAGGEARTEIRFDGDDLELVARGRQPLPDGKTLETARTVRRVDGIAYDRDDTQPGGTFRRLGKVDPVTFQVMGQYDDDGLVALVRGTRDLKAEESGGVTTYRGTTTAGAVEDAAPTAHGRSQGGAWDRKVRLDVAVGEDGFIRRVIVRDGNVTRTTRYAELGEPQAIERP